MSTRRKRTSKKKMQFTILSATISMTPTKKTKVSTSPTLKKTLSTKSSPKEMRLQPPMASIRYKRPQQLLQLIVNITVAAAAETVVVTVVAETVLAVVIVIRAAIVLATLVAQAIASSLVAEAA